MSYKVLIADDEKNIVDLLQEIAIQLGLEVVTAFDGRQALNVFEEQMPDFVLMDISMPVMGGMQAMELMKQINAGCPIILITAFGTVDIAIEAIQNGAFEYIVKPSSLSEIREVIDKVTSYLTIIREQVLLPQNTKKLVGVSASMQNIFKTAAKIAKTDATVLITGESGNGKQIIAETIHKLSSRQGRFVQINCGSIPENLMESEIFGFNKGAFSGAVTSKKGRFELSHKGSLFLDEIGELPKSMQSKLLHAIQERVITPIGAPDSIPLDLRIIAATNRNLDDMVNKGLFRLDLYHRLKVIHIHVPPLRERKDDIEPLINHFISMFAKKYNKPFHTIDKQVLQWFKNYSWPGNIRELKNLIERMILLDNSITYENIFAQNMHNSSQADGAYSLNMLIEQLLKEKDFTSIIKYFEKSVIEYTLLKYGGNRSQCSKHLGISRRNLLYKIKEYNIE